MDELLDNGPDAPQTTATLSAAPADGEDRQGVSGVGVVHFGNSWFRSVDMESLTVYGLFESTDGGGKGRTLKVTMRSGGSFTERFWLEDAERVAREIRDWLASQRWR